MKYLFVLVDCNNFYASCERLFRPELQDEPIVVLSNNDGCIVARSNEAKALGIAMGSPYFKSRALIVRHDVRVFSSNYALYGDLSNRVMTVLREIEPEVELYSIDEAFVLLPVSGDPLEYGRMIKTRVEQCVGIPVSVGIGRTRTLAKIANRFAKKDPLYQGVADLSGENIDELLSTVEVDDIWGIGRKKAAKLAGRGICNALQFKNSDDEWIRKQLTITGLRTAMELRGIACIPPDDVHSTRKSIVSSRSFGSLVSAETDLRQAIATHTSIAAAKLRAQGSLTGAIHVFIHTNRFKKNVPQYSASLMVDLPQSSSSTPTLISHALKGLARIFKPGYRYQKAGVMLTGITSDEYRQTSLFGQDMTAEKQPLMATVDRINRRWGRDTLQFAAAGIEKRWGMKQSFRSPAYTTNWDDIPVVAG